MKKNVMAVALATLTGASCLSLGACGSKNKYNAENSIIVSGTDGSISGVVLENLQIQLNYGSRRPWFGKEIDLSPHPRKAALPAEKQIPWLWSDGRSGIQWQNIRHFCKEDSVHLFDTAEVLI